jgi:hypothetical protein
MEGLYPTKAGALLQEYGYISSNPRRTDADDNKMQTLRKQLADVGIEPDMVKNIGCP